MTCIVVLLVITALNFVIHDLSNLTTKLYYHTGNFGLLCPQKMDPT